MKSIIRRKKPNYIKSTPEITAENILNRNFAADKLNEKWLTDVTEYGDGGKLYLSAILDLKDKAMLDKCIDIYIIKKYFITIYVGEAVRKLNKQVRIKMQKQSKLRRYKEIKAYNSVFVRVKSLN